jgi:hypothetical protein
MENLTLKIDPATHDITFDENNSMVMIGGAETVAQCVRVTLESFLGEWFLDTEHGTDYEQIVGDGEGDPETIIRAAVFQEGNVQYIDDLSVARQGREIAVTLSGRLKDGTPLYLEVTA